MHTPEHYVTFCISAVTRALLLHLPAVACAVSLALALAAGLQVVPSFSSDTSAQGPALRLLAVAFFAQGLLLAWRMVAANRAAHGDSSGALALLALTLAADVRELSSAIGALLKLLRLLLGRATSKNHVSAKRLSRVGGRSYDAAFLAAPARGSYRRCSRVRCSSLH
jgi:hypothetical protein